MVQGIFFLEATEYMHVFLVLGTVDKTFLTLFFTATSLDSPIACVAGARLLSKVESSWLKNHFCYSYQL